MKEIINNIEEPICSFEVSELLKEKGFGVSTSCYYRSNGVLVENELESGYEPILFNNSDFNENWNRYDGVAKNHLGCHGCKIDEKTFFTCYSAPTHSIALEWIRVNFGIHIIVEAQFDENETEKGYFFMCYKTNKDKIKYQLDYISGKLIPGIYSTPQEAIDAALLHVLKEII